MVRESLVGASPAWMGLKNLVGWQMKPGCSVNQATNKNISFFVSKCKKRQERVTFLESFSWPHAVLCSEILLYSAGGKWYSRPFFWLYVLKSILTNFDCEETLHPGDSQHICNSIIDNSFEIRDRFLQYFSITVNSDTNYLLMNRLLNHTGRLKYSIQLDELHVLIERIMVV